MKTRSPHILVLAFLALPLAAVAQSQTPEPITPPPASAPAAAIDPAAQELAKATHANREIALRLLERNAALRTDIIDTIKVATAELTGDDRTRANDAVRRINEAGAELETTITSARTATELTWADIHAELTRTYVAYTTAVREGLQTLPSSAPDAR